MKKEYLVRWEIEVTADSPRAAAQLAAQIQQDPDSLATVFQVDGVDIDLEEEDDDTEQERATVG